MFQTELLLENCLICFSWQGVCFWILQPISESKSQGDTMTKQILKKILDDLNDEELSIFQWFLQQPNIVPGLEAIRKSQLQTPDRRNTVDVMVQTYGPQRAVQVTRVILEKIPRKDLLQRIPTSSSGPEVPVSDVGEPSENREPSSSQTQPPLPQTEAFPPLVHPSMNYSNSSVENSSGKQTSLTTNTHTEGLGTYPMNSSKRGICLIINNDNFYKSKVPLKNRKGTMVDGECLQKVFEWLGFEVQTHNDCDKRKILSLVYELSRTDHRQMDCFVCCVLSHGLEGAVCGVDGEKVMLKELTDLFDGSNCPSLAGKPKLFFIQACQGLVRQRAVPIEEDGGTPSGICSDAVRATVYIPTQADYLLGMSTVPLCISFRDETEGTWFIQSLCQNLVQMVPREYHLMDIMIKVNDDVSKKFTVKDNILCKQMPQPSFTLRKKVVFPVPKASPPNLSALTTNDF